MEAVKKYWYMLPWLLMVGYCLMVWWPTRELPYHWDSAGFFINATRDLVKTGFTPWVAGHSDFAHPPLLMSVVGVAWLWFGETLFVSHAVMWIFLPVLMGSTYLIARKVCRDSFVERKKRYHYLDEIEAWGSALLVGMMPFVLVEYGLIYVDLPAGALLCAALAAIYYRRYVWMGVLLLGAVFVKESVLVGLPIFLWMLTLQTLEDEGLKIRTEWMALAKSKAFMFRIGMALLSALLFGLWLLYHQAVEGWLMVRPERVIRGASSLGMMYLSVKYVFTELLFTQGRWLLSLCGLAGVTVIMFSQEKRTNLWRSDLMPLIGLVLLGVLAFARTGEFGLRYGIFMTPAVVIILVRMSRELVLTFTKHYVRLGVLGIIVCSACLFAAAWHPVHGMLHDEYRFSPVTDLGYRDLIAVGKESAGYLETNYPDALVYGTFPEIYMLTQPYQGYVKEPLDFEECKNFSLPVTRQTIIYIHPYAPGQMECAALRDYVEFRELPQHEFVSGDTWMQLYEIVPEAESTASGEIEYL